MYILRDMQVLDMYISIMQDYDGFP